MQSVSSLTDHSENTMAPKPECVFDKTCCDFLKMHNKSHKQCKGTSWKSLGQVSKIVSKKCCLIEKNINNMEMEIYRKLKRA